MSRRADFYIADMITSIDRILSYIDSVKDFESFSADQMIVDAVTRNFEIIGEAANKIPQSVKDDFPNIPWHQMYGLRNLAIHEYHMVDKRILWEIATENLTANKIDLEGILDGLDKE